MAVAVAVGDLVHIRVWCKAEDQAAINDIYWRCRSAINVVTDQRIADFLSPQLAASYQVALANTAVYQGCEVQITRDVNEPGEVKFVSALSAIDAGPGVGGLPLIPRQVAGLLSFRTIRSGQRYRGRNYIPFPSGGEQTNEGHPTAGYILKLNDIGDIWEAFLSTQPGEITQGTGLAAFSWIIFHRDLPNPLWYSEVASWFPKTGFGSQRRRGDTGQANKSPF